VHDGVQPATGRGAAELRSARSGGRLWGINPSRMLLALRRATLVACCAALPVAAPQAQRVRGDVLQADGATPALGVVVVATAERGVLAARALSGTNGVFELRLPAAGTYTVSALRIGFRPTVVGGVTVADTGVATVRIVLTGVALPLAAVDVRSSDVCGTSHDPQAQVVQVWSEARTALAAATLWSREPLDAEWITFRRELQPGTEFVRAQQVRTTRNSTVHAFRSWDADSLAARGYWRNDASGATYFAPDPDVLLSDSFADTHCFHLEPSPERDAGLIGVGFGPQRGRGDRVEIEGTLWIDRASSELRWLDFHYVGLPDPAEGAQPGGRVEFLHLAEGPWMIGRWHIRMPIIGAPASLLTEKGITRTTLKTGGPALNGISVGGGMVSRVLRRGQVLYAAAGSGVALQLVRADSEVAVARALVTLDGTDYAWRADSAGLVQAAPVLDGRYTARIATVEMLALEADPIEREVTIRASRTRRDSATVPTAREIVRRGCGADAVKGGLAALYGIVRDSAGRPAAGRAVTVSWLGSVSTLGGRLFAGRTTNGTMSDDAGSWHVCDVPRERAVTVRAASDEGQAQVALTVPASRWMVDVPLRVRSAGVVDVDATAASLEVTVKDAAGTPVGPTSLEFTAWTGEQRKLTTDARGRALVPTFPPGMVRLRARHAGYAAGEVLFTAEAGRNTVPVIIGQATLPMLDTVRVAGNKRTSSRLDGFETRRARREATASFSADDIAKRRPAELSDLLRLVSGVRLADSSGVVMAQLSRGFKLDRDANGQPCLMRVVLDGVLQPLQAGVNPVRPDEVRGMEVFASTARTPTGLGILPTDAACGVIVIYTRKE